MAMLVRSVQKVGARRSTAALVSMPSGSAGTETPTPIITQQQSLHVDHRGTGGRSSVSGVIATVFGATGFTGRYIVNRLGQRGSQVIVPFRGVDRVWAHLKLMGDLGQIVPVRTDFSDSTAIEDTMFRSNIVVNCIGSRWDTRNFTMKTVNVDFARHLAILAKNAGVETFIHISALGASEDSPSEWARTKWQGEQAVREVFPEATILRPSTLYGFEDRFFNRVAGLVRFWPIIPLVCPNHRVAPLSVGDLAASVMSCLGDQNYTQGKTFDLLGGFEMTHRELWQMVVEATKLEDKWVIEVSDDVASRMAYFQQLLRNPRFTQDEIAFYRSTDLSQPSSSADGLIRDLRVNPEDLDKARLMRYIRHFRRPQFINMEEHEPQTTQQ